MIELFKVILFGIVEGITEWLPVSSTGHMILLNQFVHLEVSPAYWDMFLVVIQLGAILAVVVLFWQKIFPFSFKNGFHIEKDIFSMWFKILVATVPAAIVGILWDDTFNALFYNYISVAIALIVFGILFIWVENKDAHRKPKITTLGQITYKTAIWIGFFQMIAAVFPGTSRSGATIIGGLILGISRTVAAEFTFFLAIPAMFGGSALKLLKFGGSFSTSELIQLCIGTIVAFVVSILTIQFLLSYIRKHNFKVFGWYRIILGLLVLAYSFIAKG